MASLQHSGAFFMPRRLGMTVGLASRAGHAHVEDGAGVEDSE